MSKLAPVPPDINHRAGTGPELATRLMDSLAGMQIGAQCSLLLLLLQDGQVTSGP